MVSNALMKILMTLFIAITCTGYGFAKNFVVVIDPGHGGKDVGAVGNKAKEKDINLGVALKLGDLIDSEYDDIEVVYTRDDDTFISLQERAEIANKAHGDLFISIHTNSVDRRSKNRKTVHGAATYTLGLHRSDENLAVAKRENSVIELEDDYSVKYQGFDPNSTESYIIFELSQNKHLEQSVDFASLVQNHFGKAGRKDNGVRQAGFWVLAKTSMPAVLIELDFICNPTQEKYLSSSSGQKELANAIFDAFREYKAASDYYSLGNGGKMKDDKSHKHKVKDTVRKKEVKKDDNSYSGIIYKIQFLTSSKKLSGKSAFFKKLDSRKIDSYKENGIYKYTYGATSDKKEAAIILKEVRKKHPEAFIVEFKDGKRIK